MIYLLHLSTGVEIYTRWNSDSPVFGLLRYLGHMHVGVTRRQDKIRHSSVVGAGCALIEYEQAYVLLLAATCGSSLRCLVSEGARALKAFANSIIDRGRRSQLHACMRAQIAVMATI